MPNQNKTLRDIKDAEILDRLDKCEGNREAAADSLGISVTCLWHNLNRLKNNGVQIEPGKPGRPPKD